MRGDNHRALVFTGLLKCLELAAQQCGRHITVLALHDPRVDHMLVVFQENETDSLPAADCDLAVGVLQVGAGDDAGLMRGQSVVDPTSDRPQPGQPVGVITRVAGAGSPRRSAGFSF
jgi:hypothetical protein